MGKTTGKTKKILFDAKVSFCFGTESQMPSGNSMFVAPLVKRGSFTDRLLQASLLCVSPFIAFCFDFSTLLHFNAASVLLHFL